MKNRKIKIVSLFLSVILLIGFLLPSFQKNVFYELDSNENIRTVNTDELLNTSLGDAMEEFLNQFDEYECIVDEGQGQILVRETKYLDDITEVYETYINYLDSEITEFNITINTCCNNEIIQEESYIAQLCYNEEDDEFYHGGSKAGVYFEHYHPAPSSVHGLPHSFFGSPEIRV